MSTTQPLRCPLQRAGHLSKCLPVRSAAQRRFATVPATPPEKWTQKWPGRKLVPIPADGHPELVGAADNAFNRERRAITEHAKKSGALWRKLMYYVAFPSIILAAANAYVLYNEHWEHWEHMPPPSERPQYSYLNIRTRKYPWGDGNKTLFWNDKVNYCPPDKML